MPIRQWDEHIEPYYRIVFTPIIDGLTITIPAWQFRCGEVEPDHPDIVKIDLPETSWTFIQQDNQQAFNVYVCPEVYNDMRGVKDTHYKVQGGTQTVDNEFYPGWEHGEVGLRHSIRKGVKAVNCPLVATIRVPARPEDAELDVVLYHTSPLPEEAEPNG